MKSVILEAHKCLKYYSNATVNRSYTIDHSMLKSIFEWFSNRSAIPPLMWRDRKVFGMVEAWSQGRLYSKSCQGHWETLGDLFETPHAWNKDPALPGRPARAPGRHPDRWHPGRLNFPGDLQGLFVVCVDPECQRSGPVAQIRQPP